VVKEEKKEQWKRRTSRNGMRIRGGGRRVCVDDEKKEKMIEGEEK
jgi:hypothetical protein